MTDGRALDALASEGRSIVAQSWPVDGGDSSGAGRAPIARPMLVGVGWATVELDRAEAELSATLGMGRASWSDAPRDALLGASARIARLSESALAVVLLEPDTEARLAATLARSGEGVAVAYVAAPAARLAGIVLSRATSIPLGTGRLLVGGPAWGPHVVVLEG